MKNIYMTIIALATLLSFAGCTKETGCPAEETVTGRIALAAQYEAANGTVDKRAVQTKAAGNFTADDADASIQCSNIPVRYDVATASAAASATVEFPASIKAGSPEIGGLFLFAPREASVEVSLLGLGNGNETRNLGGISVAPNYVTNVTVTMNNN